jgi:hypothetical protein
MEIAIKRRLMLYTILLSHTTNQTYQQSELKCNIYHFSEKNVWLITTTRAAQKNATILLEMKVTIFPYVILCINIWVEKY